MTIRGFILCLIALLAVATTRAQQSDNENREYFNDTERGINLSSIEIDTTLFRTLSLSRDDIYAEATRYYLPCAAYRRRGLYYSVAKLVTAEPTNHTQSLATPPDHEQITLYTRNEGYRIGARAIFNHNFEKERFLGSNISVQSGRDGFVEGLFQSAIYPNITLSKRFGTNHYITLDASSDYRRQSAHHSATQEAFELTSNNYYNPAWGLYDGKVRNAYITTTSRPHLSLRYQLPLADNSTLTVSATTEYEHIGRSALGWYNATTPTPNYYRKMPSAMPHGAVRDYVTQIWQMGDPRYTQINWDEMVRLNSLSKDGSAYYVVEERVANTLETHLRAVHTTHSASNIALSYGIELAHKSERNFKELEDLLGAKYLWDKDQFIGDSYNSTQDLDNNTLTPDNKVTTSDRFGYDYTLSKHSATAIFGASFSTRMFSTTLDAEISAARVQRRGHFNKERFEGALSYGTSQSTTLAPYTLRATVGYALAPNQQLRLKLLAAEMEPTMHSLFRDPTMANLRSAVDGGEQIKSLEVGYRFARYGIRLDALLFATTSRAGSSIYPFYDDLTGTMTRAEITDIGYHSIGAEVVALASISRNLNLTATLTAGHYAYDGASQVQLYDEFDLSTIAHNSPANVHNVNIGNAPQLTSTISCAYFVNNYLFLNISASHSSMRYEQLSTIRHSHRILNQIHVNNLSTTQNRLPAKFDIHVSATKLLYLPSGERISLHASIDNLLGDRDRIEYARQSDRVWLRSYNDEPFSATARPTSYQYSAGRTFRLSASFTF